MRIIAKNDYAQRVCCSHCGSILTVEKKDLRPRENLNKATGEFDEPTIVFFVCPHCHKENPLTAEDIPPKIWKQVVEKERQLPFSDLPEEESVDLLNLSASLPLG